MFLLSFIHPKQCFSVSDAGPSPMVVTEGEHHFWSASYATCMCFLKMLHLPKVAAVAFLCLQQLF